MDGCLVLRILRINLVNNGLRFLHIPSSGKDGSTGGMQSSNSFDPYATGSTSDEEDFVCHGTETTFVFDDLEGSGASVAGTVEVGES
jgi:hypothetical protein